MRNLIGDLNKNGVRAGGNASELPGVGVHDSMNIYVWLKEIICRSGLSHYFVSLQNTTQFSHAK